ncbi:GAF domain-containing protein [Desulfolutivibrio sp.]|uniref:GAF domain-containing protein n=1 Tax=Desulfolutivibrio sp. TaxID=2773296 RepID=UPI002F961B90
MNRALPHISKPRRKSLLAAFSVALALCTVWFFAVDAFKARVVAEKRDEIKARCDIQHVALESLLTRRLTRLGGLAAYVETQLLTGHTLDEFPVFASGLIGGDTSIRSLAIAPNGIVDMAFPPEQHRVLIGHDLSNDPRPKGREDYYLAVESRNIVISGPFELLRGGLGLVARKAVYLHGVYWGVVNIALDVPDILAEAGLSRDMDGVSLALRDEDGRVFFGDDRIFSEDPVVMRVDLPEGHWELAAVLHGGWDTAVSFRLSVFQIGSLIIVFLLSLLTYFVVNRQERLSAAVAVKTRETNAANRALFRSNRALKTLSACNHVLLRATSEQELLGDMCRAIVEVGGYHAAWVGQAEDDAAKTVLPLASAGIDLEAVRSLAVVWDGERPHGRGPVGRAIRENRTVVVADAAADPGMASWREDIGQNGPLSIVSLPLRDDAGVFGVLCIDARGVGAFGDDEIPLLEELAGDMAHGVSYLRALGERERARVDLAREREQARRYLDIAGVLMVGLDVSGRITLINRKGLEILGYSDERELLGKDWIETCIPDEARQHLREVMAGMLHGSSGFLDVYENQVLRRDGGRRVLSCHNTALSDEAGGITGLLSSGEDITERKAAEDRLHRELSANVAVAAISRALLNVGASFTDLSKIVLGAARQVTGSQHGYVGVIDEKTGNLASLTLTEMLEGQCNLAADKVKTEFSPNPDGSYPCLWGVTLNTGKPLVVDDPARHPAFRGLPGGHVPLENFMSVPVVTEGHILGQIALANAPGGYGEHEVRTVSRMAVLLGLAIVRKRDENELHRAKRLADAANEAKTQFLANMSHELRTPINGIMGMVQLALAEELPDEQREFWEIARESSDRLIQIVNNLLELASIEAGALEPVLRGFSLRGLMDSLERTHGVAAAFKGLPLHFDIAPNVPDQLVGDDFRLRQVINILVGNALRHTQSGSVRVAVAPLETGQALSDGLVRVAGDFSGACLLFSVTDTGVGIPADKHKAIFDSFTLAEEYLTKKYSGSGLGLSIAKSVVELLGGTIRVESTPGEGSTFFFTSVFWPSGGETVPAQPAPAAPASEAPELPPLRVLVVEDEPVNRMALVKSLSRRGHTPVEAENGLEALKALGQAPFDLVLMDIQMPVMDGLAATRHIRNGEVPGIDRNIPVVALTAYAMESDRERFLAVGMDGYVPKPFEIATLLAAMGRAMGQKKPGDRPREMA